MKTPMPWAALAVVSAGLLAGCSTPTEVLDLAKTTAANTSVVNTRLAEFATIRRQLAERRVASAERLREVIEGRQAQFDGFLESARASAVIAGEDKKANFGTLVVELRRVADAMQARQEAAERQSAAAREETLASQAALSLPKAQLKSISGYLGELAKEPDRKERIEFLKGFLTEVLAEIDKARDAAAEAGKSAMTQIDDSAATVVADTTPAAAK